MRYSFISVLSKYCSNGAGGVSDEVEKYQPPE